MEILYNRSLMISLYLVNLKMFFDKIRRTTQRKASPASSAFGQRALNLPTHGLYSVIEINLLTSWKALNTPTSVTSMMKIFNLIGIKSMFIGLNENFKNKIFDKNTC